MLESIIRDPKRLEALKGLRAIDTPVTENPFPQIVRTVADLFDVPNAAIHLLDEENQWVKALVGEKLACRIEDSFCQYALERHDTVWVIPDARRHELFCNHPLVAEGRVRFYAAATLDTSDGFRVGTLCLTAPEPAANLSDLERDRLRQFALIVIQTLELRKDFHEVRSALATVTEFNSITGLPNTTACLQWALRVKEQVGDDARVALVRTRLAETATIKQFAGETGLNQVRYHLARRLNDNLDDREMLVDTTDGDLLFVRYFQNVRDLQDEQRVLSWVSWRCGQVDAALSRPLSLSDSNFYVSARFGLATFEAAHVEPASAMDASNIAVEKATQAGSSHAVWYSPSFSEHVHSMVTAEHALRQAVELRQFRLAFQPVVYLDESAVRVCGAEALLRWPDQSGPPLGPDLFIPLAEQKGLINEIGLWVFEEVCATLARWQKQWPIWISINVSPLQLSDSALPEKFGAIAESAGIGRGKIKLEITESALSGQFESVRDMLLRLQALGFPLALDDFGTGHSSLGRVVQLPFDFIKVDRGFVSDAPGGPGAAVVASLADMTAELGMQPIAEGVETPEQERYLRDKGYRLAQGFKYARPMFADAFEEWMRQTVAGHQGESP